MLVRLLNVPRSRADWEEWSFAHRDSHARITQAVVAKYGVDLTDYQLDPIPPNDVEGWLQRNQQAHDDMNSVIGLQSSDLGEVDFRVQTQLESWIYLHFLEHQSAEQKLGIG